MREINSGIDAASDRRLIEFALTLLTELTTVLGIEPKKKTDSDPEIERLIEERLNARKNRNFKLADEIRDKLKESGITLEDTPQGTKWKRN